jgi:hypothetical protein
MTLPAPTLDHVVVNCRDQLDEGLATYRRLGFHMTPRGYHTLGSMNHLAIFGTEYLELIAIAPGPTKRTDVMTFPIGLNSLVFGTDDSAASYAETKAAGVPVEPPMEFSRPVEFDGGSRDAVFRTVHLTPGTIPAGRFYFCHHFTRDLVWRDEWRQHANGAVGVSRAVVAASDPAAPGAIFARMFGTEAVRKMDGGIRLVVGLSSFDFVTPAAVAAQFGDAAIDGGGRDQYMVALSVRTRSLAQAEAAFAAGGVADLRRDKARIVVPSSQAMGTVLEFHE